MKRQSNACVEWKMKENLLDFSQRNTYSIFIMNFDKQRAVIAEYCGWKEIGKSGVYQNVSKGINGCMPNGAVHKKRIEMKLPGANSFLVPDYLNDLNAMHEAEQSIRRDHDVYGLYLQYLNRTATECRVHATAEQKAEAFLQAIGKWKDDK